ncbi:MAG: type II toxin-antitoxin system HicB family antitoxin [Ktedonobacteraceae bacterium]|jgi:predicted RNase H-like HicB family nuclease|nr:type II toxin-antitoxin system HicB family antitoxin [Ktedonobacteraceae bacterium]
MNPKHYSMLIQWDPRDNIYVVTIPELSGCRTHGDTYEEAIKNALEIIALWIEDAQKAGEPIPQPTFSRTLMR